MLTRLRQSLRHHPLEALCAVGFVALLALATQTGRTQTLAAISLTLLVFYVVWSVCTAAVKLARQAERDECAEIALALRVDRNQHPAEQRAAWNMQERIARAIRNRPVVYSLEKRRIDRHEQVEA